MLHEGAIRFSGNGETYFLSVKALGRRDRNVTYSFRVLRVMKDDSLRAVGGPG